MAPRMSKRGVAPPSVRTEKFEKKKEGAWEKAVCLVQIGSRRQCTGTLIHSNGMAVILCSCMEMISPEIAAEARALFYCYGQAEIYAEARLLPYQRFERLEYDLGLIAVDIKNLQEKHLLPIMPSPETLDSLTKHMKRDLVDGPSIECAAYLGLSLPKGLLALHLDHYEKEHDFLHFKETISGEAHGAPIFHRHQFIGIAVSQGFHSDIKGGVGTQRLLSPFLVTGLDLKASDVLIAPWTGANRYFIPSAPNGESLHCQNEKQSLTLSTNDDTIATLALQAVHEANLFLLRSVHEACSHQKVSLPDLRFGGDWCLAFVAASKEKSAYMLISLADEFQFDLSRRLRLCQDTLAHVAAYHGNLPALRIIKVQQLGLDSPNSRGEHPADRARDKKIRDWFRRHNIAAPPRSSCHPRYDDDNDSDNDNVR